MNIIIILLLVIGTWFLVYSLFYSPQAQVRRLLKQMFNIPIKLSRAKKKIGDENSYFYNACKKALESRYKIVTALLDYYFDPEADKEYIEEKKNYAGALLSNVENIMNK